MKNLLLALLMMGANCLASSIAFADVGMPKNFSLLATVAGPIVNGQISEIHLNQFKPTKDLQCSELGTYDYSGPELKLNIGGEEYVMDSSFSAGLGFVSDTCGLEASNISYMLLKFNHTKLAASIGVEIDLVHNLIRIASHELSSAAGNITSHY